MSALVGERVVTCEAYGLPIRRRLASRMLHKNVQCFFNVAGVSFNIPVPDGLIAELEGFDSEADLFR